MKREQNFKNQGLSGAGITSNSTTFELSKQNTTSGTGLLQATLHSQKQLHQQLNLPEDKNRKLQMPLKLQQIINKAKIQINYQTKVVLQDRSFEKNNGLDTFELSKNQLFTKYHLQHQQYLEIKSVNDLVYNESTHLVSVFKDFLILDDINEFLKRPYTYIEQKSRLPKLFTFYEKELISQQISPGCPKQREFPFPNYASLLPEPGHYIFKNIERRQRLQDQRQYQKKKNEIEQKDFDDKKSIKNDLENNDNLSDNENVNSQGQKSKKQKEKPEERLFDTQFIDSLNKNHNDISKDNKSFRIISQGENEEKLIQEINKGLEDSKPNPIIINEYSQNAIALKQNNQELQKPINQSKFQTNKLISKNLENLVQQFIIQDSMIMQDQLRMQLIYGTCESAGSSVQTLKSIKGNFGQGSQSNQFEIKMSPEEIDIFGKQYESIFASKDKNIDDQSVPAESETSFYTQRSIRISQILGENQTKLPLYPSQNLFFVKDKKQNEEKKQVKQISLTQKPQNSQNNVKPKQIPLQALQKQKSIDSTQKQKQKDVKITQTNHFGSLTTKNKQSEIFKFSNKLNSNMNLPNINQNLNINVQKNKLSSKNSNSGNKIKKLSTKDQNNNINYLASSVPSAGPREHFQQKQQINYIRNRKNFTRSGTFLNQGQQANNKQVSGGSQNNYQQPVELKSYSPVPDPEKQAGVSIQASQTPQSKRIKKIQQANYPTDILTSSRKSPLGRHSLGIGILNQIQPQYSRKSSLSSKSGEKKKQQLKTKSIIDRQEQFYGLQQRQQTLITLTSETNRKKSLIDDKKYKFQDIMNGFKNQDVRRNNVQSNLDFINQDKNNKQIQQKSDISNPSPMSSSEHSDDTVKLEDIQDAQNSRYKNDILQAVAALSQTSQTHISKNTNQNNNISNNSNLSNLGIVNNHNQNNNQGVINSMISIQSKKYSQNSQIQLISDIDKQDLNNQFKNGIGYNYKQIKDKNFVYSQNSQVETFGIKAVSSLSQASKIVSENIPQVEQKQESDAKQGILSSFMQVGGNGIAFSQARGEAFKRNLINGSSQFQQRENNQQAVKNLPALKSFISPKSFMRSTLQLAPRQVQKQKTNLNFANQFLVSKPPSISQKQNLNLPQVNENIQKEQKYIMKYKSQSGFDVLNQDYLSGSISNQKKQVMQQQLNYRGSIQIKGYEKAIANPSIQSSRPHSNIDHNQQNQENKNNQIKNLYRKVHDEMRDASKETVKENNNLIQSSSAMKNSYLGQGRSRTRPQSRNNLQKSITRTSLATVGGTIKQSSQQFSKIENRKSSLIIVNKQKLKENFRSNYSKGSGSSVQKYQQVQIKKRIEIQQTNDVRAKNTNISKSPSNKFETNADRSTQNNLKQSVNKQSNRKNKSYNKHHNRKMQTDQSQKQYLNNVQKDKGLSAQRTNKIVSQNSPMDICEIGEQKVKFLASSLNYNNQINLLTQNLQQKPAFSSMSYLQQYPVELQKPKISSTHQSDNKPQVRQKQINLSNNFQTRNKMSTTKSQTVMQTQTIQSKGDYLL